MARQHGSLTRAGKVRAMTPKVEKVEKTQENSSRTSVGRAKKRKQAARRAKDDGQPNAQRRDT